MLAVDELRQRLASRVVEKPQDSLWLGPIEPDLLDSAEQALELAGSDAEQRKVREGALAIVSRALSENMLDLRTVLDAFQQIIQECAAATDERGDLYWNVLLILREVGPDAAWHQIVGTLIDEHDGLEVPIDELKLELAVVIATIMRKSSPRSILETARQALLPGFDDAGKDATKIVFACTVGSEPELSDEDA